MTATSAALSRDAVAGASKKYIMICFSIALVEAIMSQLATGSVQVSR